MFTPTAIIAQAAEQRVQGLIEEASRHRLATALRRGRRQLWPDSLPATGRPVARAARAVPITERDRKPENVSYPAGSLMECEVPSADLTRGRVR
jgi:hypothetical protein